MHFSAMYRLRWYRYRASNKCGVGKTSYFRAKCVNISLTRWRCRLLHSTIISRHFSCFDKKKASITVVINVILLTK